MTSLRSGCAARRSDRSVDAAVRVPSAAVLAISTACWLLPATAIGQAARPSDPSQASAGLAQAGTHTGLDTVVVTASRAPQPLSSVLADISVVDRTDIERSGAVDVAELLSRLPGIEFTRNGGPGTATSVFIRGGENRHTAVYIDGVRIDSQATGGAPWEQIPLEQIERIEVLRGPAAAVYGSDAVAGVVQLFTKRGQGPARPTVSATLGSQGTRQLRAGISGATQDFDYALSASHGRSDGFNSRRDPTANPDRDGWRRNSAHARFGFKLTPRHRIEASVLGSDLRSHFDGFVPTFDDVSDQTLRTASLSWQGRWTDFSTTRAQFGQSESTYESRPDFYRSETTLRNLLLQHEQHVGDQVLTAAFERREDELLNPATEFAPRLKGDRHQNAISLGWRADFGAHGLQAHLRHDDDSEFGGETTGSLAWGWAFLPQWRLSVSTATSFRAPTLYQRFSQFGNPSLTPEKGRNLELGLRWSAGTSEASLSVWRNEVRDLIAFGASGPCSDPFGCFANVGRAEIEGVSLAGRTRVAGVTLRGSLDWHDPRDADTGKVLQRRARRMAALGAETQHAGWTWGAEVEASGARFDDPANTDRLGGYGVVNLLAATTLKPGLMLEARIDNIGDKDYEIVRGYATQGRFAQLTLRWTMP